MRPLSAPDECEQIGTDGGSFCRWHTVRKPFVGLQRAVLEQFRGKRAGVRAGNDLIALAVHNQHRNRDLLEVFGEVSLREGDDAVVVSLGTAHHALAPPIPDDRLRSLRTRAVVAVERTGREFVVKVRAAGGAAKDSVSLISVWQVGQVRVGSVIGTSNQ
jgi:hypothetical protein